MIGMDGEIPDDRIASARSLYDDALYIQAARALEEFGHPRDWKGAGARIFGARLSQNLGAHRQAVRLFAAAYRSGDPDAESMLYRAYQLMAQRGPLAAWSFLRDLDPPGQPEISASIYALRGKICAHFKDRRGMAAQFGLAFASAPDSAWIHTEHSSALELIDELAAAQSEARKALALQGRFRPAVQQLAHLLLSANEDAEALALLEDAASRMESGAILQQWIIALSERGENLRIPALCERAGQLLIWADAGTKSWLSARRADAFRGAGDFARAAAEAARCPDRLYQQSLSRLVQSDAPKARIKLDVPFIRQDDNTCAPASLASIMAYWQKDVTHEQIAEAVCYGGTVSHGLRKWVEDFGWFVREFRVTWESTCALTDRGMPFLLATSDIGGGHMQVIEGYDAVWNAILIRDPNFRHHRRVPADEFLANYRAFGPRGILILPPEEAARGRDLPLACSRDFDRLHRLNLALEANDRKAAGEEFSGLADEAAEPFLLYAARLSLAGYDGNALETLQCLKAMEEDGLDHPLITWIRLDAEKDWGDPRARLDRLRSMAERPDADPAFLALYAMELSADETTYGKALGLFRRYHSLRPRDAASLSFFGRQAWMRGDRENGRDLIRFAATCADTVEEYALEYFQAAGASGQESEALEVLKERAAAAAGKSSLPSRTLYTAYRSLGDDEEAFAALSRARDSRPDDGVLMLFCAYEYASAGQRGAAADLLRQAEGRAKETLLLRTSACLAALDGDADGADSLWRRVAELEPLALDAHFHLARATAAKDGAAACVAYWNSCCERLPFHTGFSEQRAIAALALGEEFAEPYVRDWLALLPGAVVPGCELIRLILARAAHAEALAEAERLSAVAPYSSRTAYWLGRALEESGASARAQESYERALVLDPDNAEAFQRFWFLADGAGRTRIFDWLGQQILQTPSAGGAISAWFDIAAVRLPFQEVQEKLDQIRERHRTCWPAWHCAIENLLRFHFPEKAGELAREAIAQFPLVPAVHAEAAAAFERAGSTEEAEAALQRAIVLNPSDPDLWARQAWLHDRTGNPDEGVRVLNEGIRRNPGEAALRAVLAGLLWKKNLQDEAFVQMHHALARNPGMDWAWDRFCEWCIAQSRHGHFAEFIRSVAATRPGDIGLLTMQARGLLRCGMPGEADAVIDRILILQPRNIDAHLLRTEILVGRGRFEEALDLCVGERWRDNPPALLRGQAAAVEAASKRLQRAIERIQDVVEKEPGYVWAWERLAEWSLAKREFSLARTAAVRVTELIPQRGQAWHNLAMIENTAGNEKEAVRCLREAVRREPSYEPAVLLLMEWLIFSDADDEAAQLFASASAGLSKSLALVYEIMAALKHKRRAEAEAGLSKLLMMPGVNTALLANLWEGAAKLRGRSLLDQTLDAAIWLPEIQPAAAVWWTERKIASENFAIADSLVSLSHDSGARKAAISHFLQRLRELNRGPAATDLFNR
ncbi:MAG TPA: tetratricopeptide repeat protein, partial [Terrimicrobiaceae bacterium]|nr:tetratricopeptide repeat protein [Terrimicrobiaceae bacterium]